MVRTALTPHPETAPMTDSHWIPTTAECASLIWPHLEG